MEEVSDSKLWHRYAGTSYGYEGVGLRRPRRGPWLYGLSEQEDQEDLLGFSKEMVCQMSGEEHYLRMYTVMFFYTTVETVLTYAGTEERVEQHRGEASKIARVHSSWHV